MYESKEVAYMTGEDIAEIEAVAQGTGAEKERQRTLEKIDNLIALLESQKQNTANSYALGILDGLKQDINETPEQNKT